ncbi:MAG: hypothetical protein LBV69_11405 [Bacteroidales bacterium]|nr:hypothetical protein [Bacteroidales bacterium]
MNGKWEFFYEKNKKWYFAEVPGNIHSDLLSNNLISDPFYDTNSDSLKWVADTTWVYRKKIGISNEFYERNLELVFEGIDTYSEIYFNSVKIGETNNMFRKWIFPIDDSLRRKENMIEVKIFPSRKRNKIFADSAKNVIPDDRVFSRKAQYESGWDWAPDIETCGIFKNVYINSWVKMKIDNFSIETIKITDSTAFLVANFEIESENYYNGNYKIISNDGKFDTILKKIEIFKGKHIYTEEFCINNPELWWCNGLGSASLYDIKFYINTKFRILEENIKIGIRDIKFHNEKDKFGQEFYFEINGIPVFAKGANWIPAEYFSGKNCEKNYLDLLILAKEANFNMLRVWGGGIYENDDFYKICDSLGIMVWQDFMFAGAMYPDNSEFLENIKEEVNYQVLRLKYHPSIVLWCGNNEISNAWFDWGWQKQFNISKEDSEKIWENYQNIFEKIIPTEISKLDGNRCYISTSPMYGWGHEETCTHGDSHYWGIWWGMEDFSNFTKKTGRFMSEYGFQGFPNIASLKKFIPEDSLYLFSKSLKTHQKHSIGYETINEYMERDFNLPQNFEDYVYTSQILQAEGIQQAFDAHFSEMPYCMGTLFWQFNDCWPVVSWSAVDYYKEPKALYYYAKRAFQQIVITNKIINNKNDFFVVNHNNDNYKFKIKIQQIDFSGEIIQTDSVFAEIGKLSSTKIIFNKYYSNLKIRENDSFLYLQVSDYETDSLIIDRMFCMTNIKKLQLNVPKIEIEQSQHDNCYKIIIKSNTFIKDFFIQSQNLNGIFSDNYFDLMPQKGKIIYFYPNNKQKNNEILKFKYNFVKKT